MTVSKQGVRMSFEQEEYSGKGKRLTIISRRTVAAAAVVALAPLIHFSAAREGRGT